eukprot:6490675-Prymnesium_polylepis.1
MSYTYLLDQVGLPRPLRASIVHSCTCGECGAAVRESPLSLPLVGRGMSLPKRSRSAFHRGAMAPWEGQCDDAVSTSGRVPPPRPRVGSRGHRHATAT